MKTSTRPKRPPGRAAPRAGSSAAVVKSKDGEAIRDDTGTWVAGLTDEAQAARLGRIAGLMPQIDELMADSIARLAGGADARQDRTFRAADDGQRLAMLRAVAGRAGWSVAEKAGLDAVIGDYAAARARWRAYLHGLWYTHENGRTFLAVPDGADAATFLVAREVKPAELVAELARLDGLGRTLPTLGPGHRGPPAKAPGGRRRLVPGSEGRAAPKGEVAVRARRSPRWAVPSAATPAPPKDAEPGEG